MRIYVADRQILDRVLERKRKDEEKPEQVDLKAVLKEILSWANKFVPSESGSILLDDPVLNKNRKKSGLLYFVACFGKNSSSLVGTSLPSTMGIAGRTYRTGRSYISKKAVEDRYFYSEIDKKINFQTKSIICAPIKIRNTTVGVIELINRLGKINYDANDLTLLRIFAGYTSTLIQNSLDAKRFGELSIRDNLTGLYNDRYFFDRLNKELSKALRKDSDVSLLFLDLDRFKEVNDSYGHLIGSQVLTEIGGLLSAYFHGTNAVVARYGGDEFVVILPGHGIERALEYAEGLRKEIEAYEFLKFVPSGKKNVRISGVITSSIGVASLRANVEPHGSSTSAVQEVLIKQADIAMYRSKQSGKNRVTVAEGKVCPFL